MNHFRDGFEKSAGISSFIRRVSSTNSGKMYSGTLSNTDKIRSFLNRHRNKGLWAAATMAIPAVGAMAYKGVDNAIGADTPKNEW